MMNKILYMLPALILILIARETSAQVTKVLVDKQFDVNKHASLSIEHKYGQVTCKNWDEQAIAVKVTARMNHVDEETAQKLLDKINIDVEGDRSGVSVASKFSDKLFENKDYQLHVDFDIYMPRDVNLSLEHMFGNAYIENVDGSTEINSQYGAIEIGGLFGETNEVKIGFGKGDIDYISGGELNVSYSECRLKEAGTLQIDSEYGRVTIDSIEVLEIDTEGGQLTVGEVGSLEVSSKFSDVTIRALKKNLDAETEYGSLKVHGISSSFSSITLENSFGSVELNFERGSSFNLNAEMEFCSLNYPEKLASFSKKVSTTTDAVYVGQIGEGKGTTASVEISSGYGGVTIGF